MSQSVGLYPNILLTRHYSPDSFGPEIDKICNEIHDATQGFGTNENRLLKALGRCNVEERCMVPARYFQIYNKKLVDVIESECGNRVFGRALQYMAVDPVAAECEMIEDAVKGFGSNEIFLFSIIAGRNNDEIKLLKKKYDDLKSRHLERHLCRELGGKVELLMKWCLEEGEEEYDQDKHNDAKAEEDAERLHEMGEGRWGTNERGLFRLLCTAPPKHLQAVNETYKQKYGHDLIQAVQKETSGFIEKATVFFIGMKIDPYKQIATMIHDAVKGFGTNELLLTTYIIRYQKIMDQVDAAYQTLYKKSIKRVIQSETTGQFERLLVEIAGAD